MNLLGIKSICRVTQIVEDGFFAKNVNSKQMRSIFDDGIFEIHPIFRKAVHKQN